MREAAVLVKDGDSVLLDASSTVYHLARALSGRNKLRVMTNGFEVARELAQNSSNTVILIGGVVNNDSSYVTGGCDHISPAGNSPWAGLCPRR